MSSVDPCVSVVITVLNGAATLPEQLDALASQTTHEDWELVIADNGSTDATADLVTARAAQFPVPLRLVDASAQPGAGGGRNIGVSRARGPLIAFCDADDRVAPDWVAQAKATGTRADIVVGELRQLRTPHDPDSPVTKPATPGQLATSNCVVRRDVFEALGGFDTSLPPYGAEDVEFGLRARLAGVSFLANPDLRVYFRRTESTTELLRKVWRAHVAEVAIWRKHPEVFARQLSWGWVLTQPLRWPWPFLARALAGQRPQYRAMARAAVRSVANLVGMIRIR